MHHIQFAIFCGNVMLIVFMSVFELFDCVSNCSNSNAYRPRWYETASVLLHQGKIDGTPGLPGSSGAIRPTVCQHRTHVSDFN